MVKHGFKRSVIEHFLYTKKDEDGSPIILVLYVDDTLLVRKKKRTLNVIKHHLNDAFLMTAPRQQSTFEGTT